MTSTHDVCRQLMFIHERLIKDKPNKPGYKMYIISARHNILRSSYEHTCKILRDKTSVDNTWRGNKFAQEIYAWNMWQDLQNEDVTLQERF